MKAIMISDIVTLRAACKQMLPLLLIAFAIMFVSTASAEAPALMVTVMVPYLLCFTLASGDEQSGWDRLRATLPGGRRATVLGRYASCGVVAVIAALFSILLSLVSIGIAGMIPGFVLAQADEAFGIGPIASLVISAGTGAAVALSFCACSLPLVFMQGMTRAARTVPLVLVLVFCLALAVLGPMGDGSETDALNAVSPLAVFVACAFVAIVGCAISIPLSLRFHEMREF